MYLYILKAKKRFLYKVGITNNIKRRYKEINRNTPCYVILYVPLWFAKDYERYLHNKYRLKNREFGDGSGKTEWFFFYTPFRLMFWLLAFFLIELSLLISLFLTVALL
jgi:hypothetical protein